MATEVSYLMHPLLDGLKAKVLMCVVEHCHTTMDPDQRCVITVKAPSFVIHSTSVINLHA